MTRGSEVLSPAATDLLRVLADLDGERTGEIDYGIENLWTPARCPAKFLPYLAWALSVDVWDDDWDEATKRRVIESSIRVHRIKGTRGAVEEALAALDISTRITEWWEATPPARRGTFEVIGFVRGIMEGQPEVLSERVQNNALKAVRTAKPKSRVLDFKIAVGMSDRLGGANLATSAAIAGQTVTADANKTQASKLIAASLVSGLQQIGTTIGADRHKTCFSRPVPAGAITGLQIVRATFAAE